MLRALMIALAALGVAAGSRGDPVELVGYTCSGHDQLFLLYEGATRDSSLWIRLGQSWHGYVPASFDAGKECLTVRKGVARFRLNLRVARVGGTDAAAFPLVDGTIAYGPQAKLRFRGHLISSPTGVMVSDAAQTIISGDLEMENPDGTVVRYTDAVVTMKDGETAIRARSVEMLARNPPPPPVRP